jgi:hypothetical protein
MGIFRIQRFTFNSYCSEVGISKQFMLLATNPVPEIAVLMLNAYF